MDIARYIDHTQLHPAASLTDIHTLCQEALDFDFKAVCVPGSRLGIDRFWDRGSYPFRRTADEKDRGGRVAG